jgi:hypothetical protein
VTGSSCCRTRRNWSSQVQQISHIGMAASHSPNDNQAAPIGGYLKPICQKPGGDRVLRR